MTSTDTKDYMQVLEQIRRFDRPTRARLVAQVVQELAIEPSTADGPRGLVGLRLAQTVQPFAAVRQIATQRSSEAWARLAQLRAEFAQLDPALPSPSKQLEEDRQRRDDDLTGNVRK